jgi:branched-chain amino acid transport system permease protein
MSTGTPTDGMLGRLRGALEGPNTIGSSRRFWAAFLLVVGLLTVYPLFVGGYGASQFAVFFVFALLALSLSVIWGYAGILSFGQVAFFGIAGYTFAIVSINLGGALGSTVAVPVSVLVAALAAFVLGYFMFYGGVRDVYVTIMTLVVTLVLHTFMAQTAGDEWTVGEVPLGGFNGIPTIENLSLGVGETAITFTDAAFYWLVLAVVLATYLGLRALVNGRFGYAMVAVREDEDRTEMLGYNVRKIKLLVFTLAGALAGLSGVLYVTWGNYISPARFGITFATLPVVWVSVAGRKSLLGAVVGAVVIEYFRQQLAVTGSEFAIVVVGVALLTVILVLPDGAIPRLHDLYLDRVAGAPSDPQPDEPAPDDGGVPE